MSNMLVVEYRVTVLSALTTLIPLMNANSHEIKYELETLHKIPCNALYNR